MPPTTNPSPSLASNKEGFILFFTMGMMAVLSVFGLLTYKGANLESKAAMNQVTSAEALYQADSAAGMVRMIVEKRLDQGMTLEEALAGLSVSPTGSQQFQTLSESAGDFSIIVPGLVFEFKATGWSGTAYRTLRVRYLRPSAFRAGLYGNIEAAASSGVNVYGYNSDLVTKPTASDNNDRATIGSNGDITIGGGSAIIHGNAVLGQFSGTDAEINNVSKITGDITYMGPVEPDPLGAAPGSGGYVDQLFTQAIASNNNAANSYIAGTVFDYGQGNQTDPITFTSGDYYLTEFDMGSKADFTIDASAGPVRFFMDGPFRMDPKSELVPDYPQDLQVYVRGGHDVKIWPRGDLAALIYAPFSEIDFQPQGDFYGIVWGENLDFQPNKDVYVDTKLQNSMLLNKLETLAWNEVSDI